MLSSTEFLFRHYQLHWSVNKCYQWWHRLEKNLWSSPVCPPKIVFSFCIIQIILSSVRQIFSCSYKTAIYWLTGNKKKNRKKAVISCFCHIYRCHLINKLNQFSVETANHLSCSVVDAVQYWIFSFNRKKKKNKIYIKRHFTVWFYTDFKNTF